MNFLEQMEKEERDYNDAKNKAIEFKNALDKLPLQKKQQLIDEFIRIYGMAEAVAYFKNIRRDGGSQ